MMSVSPDLIERAQSLAVRPHVTTADLNRTIGDLERAMRDSFVRPGWMPLRPPEEGDAALVWDGTCLWYDNRKPGRKPEIVRLSAAPKPVRIAAAGTVQNLYDLCTEPWP